MRGTLLRRLDKDEVDSIDLIDAMNRKQKTYVVSESGLYSLILGSRKPEAKEFKRWVTHEVLPQIRKTGGYIPIKDKRRGKVLQCTSHHE